METLRTSSYLIPVKLESEPGKYMLIHGYTGAIDIVTESLLKKIQAAASGVDLPEDTLQALIKRGYITTRSQEEEYAYVARMAKALHKKDYLLYTNFTWVVTYNCNFRCPYCFEGRDKKDGDHRIVFTQEMVDKAFRAMEQIQPHKELRKKVITLYGGEPLLAENKEIVSYIINEGITRGYKFVAITNGYDLDCYGDLLSPDKIYKVQITVDGPKKLHDCKRIHYRYGETFDKIVENIQFALNHSIKVTIRMNMDTSNINQYNDLKKFFEKKGFFQNPQFELYSAILKNNDSISTDEHRKLDFLSIGSFITKNQKINKEWGKEYNGISKKIYKALSEKRALLLSSVFCAAQVNGYVLDPLGDIYPCWEVIGNKKHLEGSFLNDTIVWNNDVVKVWHNTNVCKDELCAKCRYALLCCGGCPYYHMRGENMQCTFYKRTFAIEVNKAYAQYNKLLIKS